MKIIHNRWKSFKVLNKKLFLLENKRLLLLSAALHHGESPISATD